jgi:competence protein ComEC
MPSILLAAVRPRWVLLPIVLLGAGLGTAHERLPAPIADDGYPRRIVATLESAPEFRSPGYYLDVRLVQVDGHEREGRARLSHFPQDESQDQLFRDLELGTGDRIEVLVLLSQPRSYRNPGAFDYRRYLERQGIYWTGSIRSARLIQTQSRGWHGLDRVREWVTRRVGGQFEDGSVSQALVLGMVLGQQRRLPGADARKFQAAGLTHLLVVSGFNLALVGCVALWLGRRIPFRNHHRRNSLVFALILIWLYAVIVEGDAPVIRAALMASLMIVGRLLDRGYSIGNALSATAIVILLIRPRTLLDPSFQLTFLAVLGILLLAIPAIRWLLGWVQTATRDFDNSEIDPHLPVELADWRVRRRLWCELHRCPSWVITLPWNLGLILSEALVITVSVQSFLLPLTVESYHRVSPISLPLNVVGTLVASCVTPMGLLLIVLPDPFATLLGWITERVLGLFILTVDWGLAMPAAALRVPSPPIWIWFIYSIVLLGTVSSVHRRWRSAAVTGLLLFLILVHTMVFWDFSPRAPAHPVLTFLDVGQGDSTLIELPSGERIVIDGGGVVGTGFRSRTNPGTFSIGEDVVSAYLFSRGFRRLDAIVLTHAHHDHMDGLFDLIRNFEVGEVWLGTNPMLPRYRQFLEEIYRRQIPIRWLARGDRVGPFLVLHPPLDREPGPQVHNDDSLVLLLEWSGEQALFTGDLESDLPGLRGPVHVLKVPHHGSSDARLEVRARVPVISVGSNNRFGHPHPTKLPALRTDILGAIQIVLEPGRSEISFPGLKEKR